MAEQKLGELLIQHKLITREQFSQALEMQRLTPQQPIGQILCMLGFLSAKDLDYVLDHNKKRRKLGEILIAQGVLDQDRLHAALELCRTEKIPLGRALIRQHLVEEEQLARAIAHQHDLPFVNLTGIRFDPELSRFVNATFAQRLRIVPTRCRDNCLTIAMAYPIQRDELTQLESWCNMKIVPVIAKESDILISQQMIYKISRDDGDHANLSFELSEDQARDAVKSRYVNDFISADVDYLTKRIIATGIKEDASDIHFESIENGMIIRYRIDGILQTIGLGADDMLISTNARQIISKIKILCDMDIAERRRPQDSSFKMKVAKDGGVRSVDFRVSTVPTPFGENAVIRILDKRKGNITLEGLGYFAEDIKKLHAALEKPTGIFLVTGPTGSGKSSTLYAILSHINTPGTKTLTVEDPVEYSIEGITQTEVNEVIGNTFARMLRAFLRQDPDNVMVGEIRDLETATIAMRAALTGHTVLSTLHTNDATSAVTRLIDMGVEPGLISTTLRCVIAQRLVRCICSSCKISYVPPLEMQQEFGILPEHTTSFFKGKGCPTCHYTGYSGRRPIIELWIPGREELLLLNRRPDNLSLRKTIFSGAERLTMVEDGFRRVLAGETTLEELMRTVPYEQIEEGREKIRIMIRTAGYVG